MANMMQKIMKKQLEPYMTPQWASRARKGLLFVTLVSLTCFWPDFVFRPFQDEVMSFDMKIKIQQWWWTVLWLCTKSTLQVKYSQQCFGIISEWLFWAYTLDIFTLDIVILFTQKLNNKFSPHTVCSLTLKIFLAAAWSWYKMQTLLIYL